MSTKTTNYNFTKPAENEYYDVNVQNDNWDKADDALTKKVTAAGGDIANTIVSAIDASTASFPVPAAKDKPRTLWGKVKKWQEDCIAKFGNYVLKSMISSQQINDSSKVPSSALAYLMQQAITENANDISVLNTKLFADKGSGLNFNDFTSDGFYTGKFNYNTPDNTSESHWNLEVSAFDNNPNYVYQRACKVNGSYYYCRYLDDNDWSVWRRFLNVDDIRYQYGGTLSGEIDYASSELFPIQGTTIWQVEAVTNPIHAPEYFQYGILECTLARTIYKQTFVSGSAKGVFYSRYALTRSSLETENWYKATVTSANYTEK